MDMEGATPGLSEYVAIVRRQWWLASIIPLIFIGAALLFTSRQSDVYESQATVLLRTGVNSQLFPPVGNNFASFNRLPAAELEFVESDAFRAQIPPGPTVRVSAPEQGSQLVFSASADTPAAAVAAANTWAETYVRVRHDRDVLENEVARADAEEVLAGLESDKATVLAPLRPLDDALARETEADDITLLTTQRLALQQSLSDELLPIENGIRSLSAELTELNSVARFLDRPDISALVSRQAVAGRKTAPLPARDVGLATLLGLVTALAAALLYDSLRNRLSSVEDVRRLSGGLPVLSDIPLAAKKRNAGLDPAVREGIERLLTSVGLASRSTGVKVVLITSAQESEGKTSTAVWMAQRAAHQGLRVLVIDADLRRPQVHVHINVARQPGLADLEASSEFLLDDFVAVVEIGDDIHFDVLTAGVATDHPSGILRGPTIATVVAKLSVDYDLVLIDTPPILPVSDAEILAELVADGVILLGRVNRTRRDDFLRALDRLRPLDVELLGTVLVGTRSRSSYYQT